MKVYLVSILICSRDRRKALEALVTSLMTMEADCPFEIVIVEETGNPVPIDGAIYVPHPIANRGIPYARNLALANAKGEIIVFLDDDCVISDGWLDNLLEPFKDDSVVGIQGGVTVPNGTNAIGWAESILGFPGGGISRVIQADGKNHETIAISTLNCAYRRWVIDKVGRFDESLKLGFEDYLLAKQACRYARCLFVPNALVQHSARGKFPSIWPWFVRRGHAEVHLIKSGKLKELSISSIAGRSLVLKICLLAIVGILFPGQFVPLLVIAGLLYFSLQYVRCFRAWKRSQALIGTLLILPIVKFVMDIAMDWGRIRGLVS